ncbi:MAG: endolytic transglycosylase MltG [Thermodesulfobacteriota bacterium]|nr:endolytic transglycosylase MltG [Thermodesulfobacteriota bacterium]
MKFINEIKLFIAVTCIIIPFVLYAVFSNYAETPTDNLNRSVTIEIPKGASFSNVTAILEKENLIKHKKSFYLLARLKDAPTHIRAGEYDLNSSMSPADIINKLIKGKIKGHYVLIPEGFNISQIAARLTSMELVNEEKFIEIASDPEFVSSLGIQGSSVEGYLFPDTYILSRSMDTKEIIKFMVTRFRQKVTPDMIQRAKELGFTTKEFVTLASIIEKEGGPKEERALISAVFHNRLKKGIKLQSDPTVIYGIKGFDGNIKRKHLREKTPYNTYRIKGLPPGPISNPGMDSLLAALYPASVDYLFFVSKNNGTHYFSSDLTSHNKAVLKYQIKRRKR